MNEEKNNEITPKLWEWQFNRLDGAIPNFHLDENGQVVWYEEVLERKFKGSDLIKAVDSIIEALTRGDKEAKFLDLGIFLKFLYKARDVEYKEERQKEKRAEEKARHLTPEDILNGGRGEISELNKRHIKATQDFLNNNISREEWERIKAEIAKEKEADNE